MGQRRRTAAAKWCAIGAAGILLAASLYFMGSVVVVDEGEQIVSAAIVASDGASQPLHRMPGHVFAAVPRLEGEIAIRCRDGSVGRGDYVTPHLHVWIKIKTDSGCGTGAR